MTAPVFISHSSRDRSVAEALCTALEERGVACWLASRDIGPGENFQEAIVRAVQAAPAMVLVFTANANNSDEIKKELALASQNRTFVIPVRAEDVLPSDAFRYELATRQWIDVFKDWEQAMGRLAEQVRVACGEAKVPVPQPPVRKPVPRRWPIALAALFIVFAIAGAALWLTHKPAAPLLTGLWTSDLLSNPYAPDEKYTLEAEFRQSGTSLTGSIKEIAQRGGAVTRAIRDGRVADGQVTFHTRLEVTDGDATQMVREIYQGTLDDKAMNFTRQNDAPTGGEIEHFVLRRK